MPVRLTKGQILVLVPFIAVMFYVVFQTGHELVRVNFGDIAAARYDVVLAFTTFMTMVIYLTKKR
jgi:hypothetical protein